MEDSLEFIIRNLKMKFIQGGMGVKVSGESLASAVANAGGAGIVAAVGLGLLGYYPNSTYSEANQEALRKEIRAARAKTEGVLGVNIMRALTDYEDLVKVAAGEDIDMIISGAGIAKDLPSLVGDKPIALVPIVSDLRTAEVITKAWKRQGRFPDAFIVEGPKAGGHLGFKYDDLVGGKAPMLEDIAKEVIDFAESIPVVVAGGVYTGGDILKYKNLGAAGVQMATRFVTTHECDASDAFKWAYVNAKEEDIKIIKSPVGMPGRAIENDFLKKARSEERAPFRCAYQCLKTCKPKESPYCIAKALVNAQQGNLDEGFVFAGENAHRATRENCWDPIKKEFITVETLMNRIYKEYDAAA